MISVREEIRSQASRRYSDFLRSLVVGEPIFPLEVRIGKTKLPSDYAPYQARLQEIRATALDLGVDLEWSMVSDRRFGPHEKPVRAYFQNESAFLRALGKGAEVEAFQNDIALIRKDCPALEQWLRCSVRKIVANHGIWPGLLATVKWLGSNPCSGMYARELPIPGVHTKFIERNQDTISELVAEAYPGAITQGAADFDGRHGLKRVELTVRFRFLDQSFQRQSGFPVADVSLPLSDFQNISIRPAHVIVTENIRNFLALPPASDSVAIFGGGNGLSLLHGTKWLAVSPIHYWGDIDAHGFAILSRFRKAFSHAMSLMMDEETFAACSPFVVDGAKFHEAEPEYLSDAEKSLFDRVNQGNLRLEQERIPFAFVCAAMQQIASEDRHLPSKG